MADDGALEFDDLEDVFRSATKYVRQISGKLETEKLLYFYGRYKQASEGKCNTAKPSFFDFQGKSKWDAWNKLGDMSKTQAMMEYVSLLSNIDQEWNTKVLSEASGAGEESSSGPGMGVAVSVMANPDADLRAEDKTVFDWCKEGDVDKVREMLVSGAASVNDLDEEGLGLLHWASDRGLTSMVEMLLSVGADINITDGDQQTALHYAVSCGHTDMTRMLVERGVDQTVKDSEGHTAADVASDDMKLLLLGLAQDSVEGNA
ncbi:acyl-CoA-binding domain-containing protein 6-like [Plakobranchus ocellatus]|uniref:Acyl-CoA-binding domain-containing protein 6 n=1 Tax=Plakobranchus ocellatus TaxID=259542 RepID=A0AAV3ZLX7_9GAST|nr:acyl-CoA-binding domain-containing protein 6-like [Plakobranchus ocellatus]